jgi:ATP-dependent Clp protease adaptor protein ClpS
MELFETSEIVSSKEKLTEIKELILYNDDVNTFEHVIKALVEICGHELIQAEQCTFIVHTKGKCIIKNGILNELLKFKNSLQQRGLTVAIK